MENASKALIMAGGVLIGILIISLAVYLFADFGSTSAQINAQNSQKQITEFNSKFTSYEEYKDKDGNWKITIYDIITLASYAKENNQYYEDSIEEKIDVKIDYNAIQNNTNKENQNLISDYTCDDGTLKKFKCSNVEYNARGKVKSITFKELN